ncbi:MAG: sulfurtransferase-like selenium metabolism protein YedF [Geobacter sp.]|jgi:selenium metabolism protein YedF|nr:sulfurtransferase-like selenium metabolism protein YedF [Geobacter sp.]
MRTIDCRGQTCPAPVLAVKKGLEESTDGLCVLLDNGAPHENVSRFAKNRGYVVTETPDNDGWSLLITRGAFTDPQLPPQKQEAPISDRILLITSERLGDGPEELGRLLMKNFIITLLETEQQPGRILLLNTGVLLATNGAETLTPLKRLEERGVELFACGVCLDFLHKKEELAVGKITNMFSTAEQLLAAGSVIKL